MKKAAKTVMLHKDKTFLNVVNIPRPWLNQNGKGFCRAQKTKQIVEIYNVTIQMFRARKGQRKLKSVTQKLKGSDESVLSAWIDTLLKELKHTTSW